MAIAALGLCLAAAPQAWAGKVEVEPDQKYLLLSTTKTSTMEEELTQAAALGFRIVLAAPSGVGQILLLEKVATPPDLYQYKLLATVKISTMEKELAEAAREGYRLLPRTIMPKAKMIGPMEIVCVAERPPKVEKYYEYKLLGTSKTSTLQKEITENTAKGYSLSGMATANERTVIMEREVPGKTN